MTDSGYMSPENLWPHLPSDWLVGRGETWLAVAKPTAVPAGHGPLSDGLLDRVASLAATEVAATDRPVWREMLAPLCAGKGGQRASSAASGIVLLSRENRLLGALDKAREQGRFEVVWLVGVQGWPAVGGRALAARAALDTAGIEVLSAKDTGGRCLLTLRARTDAVDVAAALRKLGFPIAGDPRDERGDGASGEARRGAMMLHRAKVKWPGTTLEAAPPACFHAWLHDHPEPLGDRLDRALRRRHGVGRAADTSCLRLFDDETDLTIDAYGPDVVVSSYADLPERTAITADELRTLLTSQRERAATLGRRLRARQVFLKLRPRQANTVVDAVRAGLTPSDPVWTADGRQGGRLVVQENGVRYWVELDAGLATGIFLDQRDNRRWMRDHCADRRVLNTFAYTCGFSVAAAVGGARRTVSIDAAAPALELGRANLLINGHDDPQTHDTIRGDVLQWLPKMARRGDRFDVVILDPPSYSKVRKRRFSVLKDYADLVATALPLLDSGGHLLACINHTRCDRRRLHQMVLRGCKLAGRHVESIEHRKAGIDYPTARMKSVLVRVR